MNVGHERHLASACIQPCTDVFQIGGILDGRRRDPDHLASHLDKSERLADTGLGIHRVAGDHRLDTDRICSTKAQTSHDYFTARTSCVGKEIGRVAQRHSRFGCGITRAAHGFAGEADEGLVGEKVMISIALSPAETAADL